MESKPEVVEIETDEISQIKTISADVVVSDASSSSTTTSTDSDAQLDEMARDLLRDELDDQDARLSQKWKKPGVSGVEMVQKMLEKGLTPRQMLRTILGPECPIPSNMPEAIALKYFVQIASERRHRDRLPQFNDFRHAVQLFNESKKVLFITGAGISVSCGIPDFRSSRGLYAQLKETYPDLPHPTAMFDINFFRSRPEPFFSFAKELFPGAYKPSISHMFIRFLELEQKLLRNYSQNIDTLEQVAGIERRIECHGSFGSATCLECAQKYSCDDIREDIYAQRVARCKKCERGVIKPDIVFFGQDLPEHFHNQMAEDRGEVDLLVVIGSSLQVQPVSLIPFNVEDDVPQILINKEDIPSYNADIKLLGDCDTIITALCMAMGGRMQELMLEELKSRPNFESKYAELEEMRRSSEDGRFFPSFITRSEVLKLVGGEEAEEEESNENNDQSEAADEDEIPVKRPRLSKALLANSKGESSAEMDGESSTNKNGAVEGETEKRKTDDSPMWENRYVHVPSVLTGNMYAKFEPNLNIFPAAEIWFDRDLKTFGSLPRQAESSPSSPSCCGGNESDSSSSISDSKSAPELPNGSSPFVVLSPTVAATPRSCPNSFGNDDESRTSESSDSS